MSPPSITEVALAGMRFHACVGILPHEREHAQPIEVDVAVRHGMGANAVLDYRELYAIVRDAAGQGGSYLEVIAEDIASHVLGLTGVTSCRVEIRKPHVALGGPLDHARVTIERTHA